MSDIPVETTVTPLPPEFVELCELFDIDVAPLEDPKEDTVAYWVKAYVLAGVGIVDILDAAGVLGDGGPEINFELAQEFGAGGDDGAQAAPPTEEYAFADPLANFGLLDSVTDVVTDAVDGIASGAPDMAVAALDSLGRIASYAGAVMHNASENGGGLDDYVDAATEPVGMSSELVSDRFPSLGDVGECIGDAGPAAMTGAVIGGAVGGLIGLNAGAGFNEVARRQTLGQQIGQTNRRGNASTDRLVNSGGWRLIDGIRVQNNPRTGRPDLDRTFQNPIYQLAPVAVQGGIMGLAGAAVGGLLGGSIGTMSCLLERNLLGDRVPVAGYGRAGGSGEATVRAHWRRRPQRDGAPTVTASAQEGTVNEFSIQTNQGVGEALHELAKRILDALDGEVAAEAALDDEDTVYDVSGSLSADLSQLAWQVGRANAMRQCGLDLPSGDPGPMDSCTRDGMADTVIPMGNSSDITAAINAVGVDTFKDAIQQLGNMTDPYNPENNLNRYDAWNAQFGEMWNEFVGEMPNEVLGDQIMVIGYSRSGTPVRAHLRSRPKARGGTGSGLGGAVGRSISVSAAASAGEMVFGEHAAETPQHMLTAVRFPNLVRLDERTGDGRLIRAAGFGVRDLPLSFSAMFTTQHGTAGSAYLAGMIDEVTVHPDGIVSGQGWLLDEADGRRAGRLIQSGALRGNSVELAGTKTEITMAEDDSMLVDFIESKLAATTLVANPAMEGCTVELVDPDFQFGAAAEQAEAASFTDLAPSVFSTLAPTKVEGAPPREWTEDPGFDGPTPGRILQPDNLGRIEVYGHLAEWDTPHLGVPGTTLIAPKSMTDYAYFANGETLCADGTFAPTGVLTMGAGHAAKGLDWREASSHYDDSCFAWAAVAVGEDEFGIWYHGYVLPGTDPDAVTRARALGISGDWRRVRGNLELVAALSVNARGFPIGRPSAFSSGGLQTCLTGAGALAPAPAPTMAEQGYVPADPESIIALRMMANFVRKAEAKEIGESLLADQSAELAEITAGLV